MPKKFLTEEETLRYLGIDERKLADLRRDSELPYVALDYRTRIYLIKSLDTWVEKHEKVETLPESQ